MERGKRQRTNCHRAGPQPGHAGQAWETVTSYDRYTQFVPDVLVSQREGQDGPAVIVHTVSLTHLMFFVFKVNLHLLHSASIPSSTALEFERHAVGDFEKFDGYIEITPDPAGTKPQMNFHLTCSSRTVTTMPGWAVTSMTQHLSCPCWTPSAPKAEAY